MNCGGVSERKKRERKREMSGKGIKVCVTGASGYVASHIVKQLLEREYEVVGTVRDTSKEYPYLTELPGAAERLTLAAANLVDEGSFDAPVAGCEVVFHTASPFAMNVTNPQEDLVDPAVRGTLTVLESAAKAGVRKVVLTSSVAAVTDSPINGHVYTEDDWNEESTLNRNPYFYSKAEAERSAWRFVREYKPPADGPALFDLAVMNPFLIIGPNLAQRPSESTGTFKLVMEGKFPAAVKLAWSFIDVRDVAHAHIEAAERKEAVGRFILARPALWLREVVDILREEFPGYSYPRFSLEHKVGTWMALASAVFEPKDTRVYLKTNLGRFPTLDNTRAREILGMEFRDVRQSILDTVHDMIAIGQISKI